MSSEYEMTKAEQVEWQDAEFPQCDVCEGRIGRDCKCEECSHCSELVRAGEGERDAEAGYVFCDSGCRDSHAERAYERFCSDYYGGSGPVTDREKYVAASEEKRRLG